MGTKTHDMMMVLPSSTGGAPVDTMSDGENGGEAAPGATVTGARLAAERGVFAFDTGGLRGTLTVMEGSTHGFLRLVVYVHRIEDEVMATPVRMEAERRGAWISETSSDAADRSEQVVSIVRALFEAADMPMQRSVRISVPTQ